MNYLRNVWESAKRALEYDSREASESEDVQKPVKISRQSFGQRSANTARDSYSKENVQFASRNAAIHASMNALVHHAGYSVAAASAVAAQDAKISDRQARNVFSAVEKSGSTLRKEGSGRPNLQTAYVFCVNFKRLLTLSQRTDQRSESNCEVAKLRHCRQDCAW